MQKLSCKIHILQFLALSGLKFEQLEHYFKLFHMTTQLKEKKERNGIKRPASQSGPSLLNIVNPQDYMEGPLDPVIHIVKGEPEKDDTYSKEETSRKRVENMS